MLVSSAEIQKSGHASATQNSSALRVPAGGIAVAAAEVTAEELRRVAELRPRDPQVPARIGVQRLVPRAEQVEERQAVGSGEQLVVQSVGAYLAC